MAVLFVGAGASKEFDIPLPTDMSQELKNRLEQEGYRLGNEKQLYNQVLWELRDYPELDIEAVITVLEHLIQPQKTIDWAVSHPCLFPVLGRPWDKTQELVAFRSEMHAKDAASLLREIKGYILEVCNVTLHPGDKRLDCFRTLFRGITSMELEHDQYPPRQRWTGQLDVFTTNYDRLIEQYCDLVGWNYNNGEGTALSRSGALNLGELQKTKGCRIHKLHGTINWYEDARTGLPYFWPSIPKPGERDVYGSEVGDNLLLFPTKDWYTFREPFYPLFHSLKQTLVSSENQCIIVGYSIRDEDIRTLLFDASKINRRLTFCLIDPRANEIISSRLGEVQDRVHPIPKCLREVTTDDIQEYMKWSYS